MHELYAMMGRYNRWANGLLYDAAYALPDEEYRRDVGAYFGSLHGTLNHLIVGDRIWLSRFEGHGSPPLALEDTISDDKTELRLARDDLDARIIDFVDQLDDGALKSTITYVRQGVEYTEPLAPSLTHFFNHQTHHRGQCHTMLTQFTGKAPSMDLIFYLRALPQADAASGADSAQ